MEGNGKFKESCDFCLIGSDRETYTDVIKKDDELVCFRDICPAAPHHYLVIPRHHIVCCFSLSEQHVGLVKRMEDMARAVLHEHGITDMKDIRRGFHQPPYTSVDHLHLHVLAPASKIPHHVQFKFIPGTQRFITVECLQKQLKKCHRQNTTIGGNFVLGKIKSRTTWEHLGT